MSSRYDLPADLDISETEDFNKDRLDRAFYFLMQQILLLQSFQPNWEEQLDLLRQNGLTRLNDALMPIYEALVGISQVGIMFNAVSTTPNTIGTGLKTFTVSEIDRVRFAAAGYLSAQDAITPENTVFGLLQSYNRDTGTLTILVDQFVGEEGHQTTSWRISAAASPNVLTGAHQVGAYTQAEVDTMIQAINDSVNSLITSKANRTSPQLLGTPRAPTVNDINASGDQIATLGFVQLIAAQTDANIRAGAPVNLNTLGKLSNSLGGDPNFVQTMAAAFATVNQGLANRLRVDAGQGLNDTQRAQARSNISAQQDLGFYPIQQGGGANQSGNKIRIGWGNDGKLRAQVDDTDLGPIWTDGGLMRALTGRGYHQFPSGLFLQWGGTEVDLDGAGNARVDWPSWFPSQEYWAMAIVNTNSGLNPVAPVTFGHNYREFWVNFPGRITDKGAFSYIAIGR